MMDRSNQTDGLNFLARTLGSLISLHNYLPNRISGEAGREWRNSLFDHRRKIANDFTLD
jgi:hypothetical protein